MASAKVSGSEDWDPSVLEGITPTPECIRRLGRDLRELGKNPLPGIYCVQDDVIVTKFHALLIGPFDTPYEGGFFYFTISCPSNYPNEPPKVKFHTTGGGTVRFNPNLYANGKVCLSILGTWSGPGWEPVQTLSSLLLSIQSLMCERPYHNEPGFEVPNLQASQNYNDCIRHETLRVAVCAMFSSSSMASTLPSQLRELIHSLYPGFYDSYEIACTMNSSKDGQSMIDPFGEPRGKFNYSAILEKLETIMTELGGCKEDDGDFDTLEDEDSMGLVTTSSSRMVVHP